jgi:predicted phosphoserine aminotransferase
VRAAAVEALAAAAPSYLGTSHRQAGVRSVVASLRAGLRQLFALTDDWEVVLGNGGSTFFWDVATFGLIESRSQHLCFGEFSSKFAQAVSAAPHLDEPVIVQSPAGTHPEAVATPGVDTYALTHNETSTGVTNPLRQLARDAGRIVVVDGVSSVGSIAIETDAWGVDVAVSASQKGWMAPPGLAMVSVSQRAWAQQAKARSPRFYFDWKETKSWADKGMTPFTPAIGVAFALQEGIHMLEEEGLENVFERHGRLARATQAGLEALGFQLYARDGYRSHTVTSAVPPPGLDVAAFRSVLDTKFGVVIAGGQGRMTGKMVRVGHLGAVEQGDVVQVIWAMEQALEELDVAPADGRGVTAVTNSLQGAAAATG